MIQKNDTLNSPFYTWKDDVFSNFMMKLLSLLEPKFVHKYTIVLNELEEVNELYFVVEGDVLIGYEFNKITRYFANNQKNCVIGMYGTIFNQRSEIIYTAKTDLEGYFIRKFNWRKLMKDFTDFELKFKK